MSRQWACNNTKQRDPAQPWRQLLFTQARQEYGKSTILPTGLPVKMSSTFSVVSSACCCLIMLLSGSVRIL